MNQDEGLDVYALTGSRVVHETSLSISSGVGSVGVFVPILCVHDGAGILVGGLSGVVRILSAEHSKYGATLQTYRGETGNSA